MFGGKKEKALQDELYTIKKQIAEYSDELKEDSVQMTASRGRRELQNRKRTVQYIR